MVWKIFDFIFNITFSGFFVQDVRTWFKKILNRTEKDKLIDSLIMQYLKNQRDLIKFADGEDNYYTVSANAFQHKASIKDPRNDIQDRGVDKIKSKFRLILSRKEGGTGLPPQFAHLDKRYRNIINIVRHVELSREPLILLGDPGAGKSLTLRETFLRIVEKQITNYCPVLVIFIRLVGVDFLKLNDVKGVKDFVINTLPEEIKVNFDFLVDKKRVLIFFDGMDEMDRCHYNESVKVLSNFADAYRKRIKTVFSCRLNEFSKEFLHRQVVLLPFDSKQIIQYFEKYLKNEFRIDGEIYCPITLLKKLKKSQFCDYIANPFFLNIFSVYIYNREKWPDSLAQIYHNFFEIYYKRYMDGIQDNIYLGYETALNGWAKIAYCISTQMTGGVINKIELRNFLITPDFSEELLEKLLEGGSTCRIFRIEKVENDEIIRFEHHRYLEYFTAYYIKNDYSEVDWQEKLRYPRWQETFLILASLNTQFSGIEFLEQALSEAVNDLTALKVDFIEGEEPNEQTEQERIWSEYALLGARVINRIGKRREDIGKCFWRVLINAIKLLAEIGHPLSQRTVVWACSYLDKFNIYEILERPFVSKYFFVRSVALNMIDDAFRFNKDIGASYHYEICRGVATEHLLRYLHHFAKGFLDKFSLRNLWSFMVGVTMPLLISFLVFKEIINLILKILPITRFSSLPHVNIVIYAIMIVVSIYLFLDRNLSLNQSICLTAIGLFWLYMISTSILSLFGYFILFWLCVIIFHILSISLFFIHYITTTISILLILPRIRTKNSIKILYSSILSHSKVGRFINRFSGRYLNHILFFIAIVIFIAVDLKTNIFTFGTLILLMFFLIFLFFVLFFSIINIFIKFIRFIIKSTKNKINRLTYRDFEQLISQLKTKKIAKSILKRKKNKLGLKFYFLPHIDNIKFLKKCRYYISIIIGIIIAILAIFNQLIMMKILLIISVFYFLYRLVFYLNTMTRKVKLPDDAKQWVTAFEKAKNSLEAMKLLEHLEKLNKRKISNKQFMQILLDINSHVIKYDRVYDRYLEIRSEVQDEIRFEFSIEKKGSS